jgi:tetratricopeptide (TPR) repeat protein
MIGLGHPFTLLSSTFLLGDAEFRAMAGEGPLHLDDKPTLEFTAPRSMYTNLSQFVDQKIMAYRKGGMPDGLIGFNPTKKEWAHLYNLAGESYLRQQNIDDAEKSFQKAFDVEPNYARTWANKGRIDNLRMQHFQAEKDYRRAIELDNTYALPWFHLGMLYLEQGEEDQALKYLMEGHKRAPEDPMGAMQVASLQMKRGELKEAQITVEKALAKPIASQDMNAGLQNLLQVIKQKSPAP